MANISEFNGKKFNPQVFDKYTEKVPNLKKNELIKNGVFDVKNKYKALCTNQDGGDYVIEPIKGLLDGDVQNYDGVESFVPTSRKTFSQGKPIFGRMKAWQEKDFSTELTGVNWMKDAAAEVAEYYQGVDQDDLLAILEGIFKMDTSDAGNAGFVEKHSTEIEGNITSSTANNAAQKACGDNKKIITMAFMHSDIATNLENMQLLTYMLYNDAEGIQRQLNIATWNGKVVIIDDSMPFENVATTYKKTTDAAVVEGKDYYTKSGSTYTKVDNPVDANISSYYEVDVEAHPEYTTYLLGKSAFEYENIGVKVPSETARDPKTNGGIDVLYTRQRHLVSPKFISYTKASQATSSATKAELATGSNWELVHDGAVSGRTYVNHKAIPIVKIVSRG